jgi:small subunit ribosomal protein S6
MSKKEISAVDESTAVEARAYEIMFVLKPDLLESKALKKVKEAEEMITKAGGTVAGPDFWGICKLAYKIKSYDRGYYNVLDFTCPTDFIKELNEYFRIDPEVIRHLILTLPDDYKYIKYREEKEDEAEIEARKKAKKKEYVRKDYSARAPKTVREEPAEIVKTPEKSEPSEPKEEKVIIQEPEARTTKPKSDLSDLDATLDALLGGDDLNL